MATIPVKQVIFKAPVPGQYNVADSSECGCKELV